MSKEFIWTDEIAEEYAKWCMNKEHRGWGNLSSFKKLYQPKEEKKEPERIEVTRMVQMKQTNLGGNEPHLNIYFNQWPDRNKHERIKQAIESVLNDDKVDYTIWSENAARHEKKYTQKEVDEIEQRAFEAADKIRGEFKFQSFQEYKNYKK